MPNHYLLRASLRRLPHTLQMLHGCQIHIKKPIYAVGQTGLFRLVERCGLDGAGDALFPTKVCEVVAFYPIHSFVDIMYGGEGEKTGKRGHTSLNFHPLGLVLDKGAKLGLVFVVEPIKVCLFDLWSIHR